jgi:RimJ/RimL family protein N-acetyltransferase/acyl carrier protein
VSDVPADISFDDFRAVVASIAGVDVGQVDKGSRLWDDLGFDSIRMVELMVDVAELGVAVPEDVVADADTVWQAYEATTAGARATTVTASDPVVLETARLRLRPIRTDDHLFLYGLATSPDLGWRLRSRGLPLSGDEFVKGLYEGVLAQFVVDDMQVGQRVGLVQAADVNLIDGHARVSAVVTPERIGTGWIVEALGLFADYLFATFPLRKLVAEVPAFAWPALASGDGGAFAVEGRLQDHRYASGRWWDVYLVALRRDEWMPWAAPKLATLRGGTS